MEVIPGRMFPQAISRSSTNRRATSPACSSLSKVLSTTASGPAASGILGRRHLRQNPASLLLAGQLRQFLPRVGNVTPGLRNLRRVRQEGPQVSDTVVHLPSLQEQESEPVVRSGSMGLHLEDAPV